jgi:hypothetical protein
MIVVMPLENGQMIAQFFGRTPHAQAVEKIAQMRRDLSHIQHALNALERRLKANTPGDQMSSEFTLLYNWCVSLMESLFAMTWASYDKAKVDKVIKDFENKFKTFTSTRTMVLTGRQ